MKSFLVTPLLLVMATGVGAQTAPASRIRGRINSSQTAFLRGHVHPLAKLANDRGAVAGDFPLPSVTLYLKPSPAQKMALAGLLASQQDPRLPMFHQWLTPEQFGERFGTGKSDYKQIGDWLKSQGFKLAPESRGRRWITFQATASQVEAAFQTSIHRYQVNGEAHFANTTDPAIPAALAGMVEGLRGLNDFGAKARLNRVAPLLNLADGTHALAPDDFATIYDSAVLYAAGVDGTGQTIAIAGQTAILTSDLEQFRTQYSLGAQTVKQILVPGANDPGIVAGDIDVANVDIQWAGAVARNATIAYVYSGDVQTSIDYIVDHNVAPVFASSYGLCEAYDLVDLPARQMTAQQANAQGQTWVNAAGDAGASDCDQAFLDSVAQAGLAVDAPSSIPEVTGVGGTQFNDAGSTYWAATTDANKASALSYIPEIAWNSTSATQGLSAGGGGVSVLFPKPVWQTGPGVPTGGFRNTPDVALSASDYTPVAVVSQGQTIYRYGTSVASTAFAGILTLLNQYLVSSGAQKQPGLGNVNPTLYRLAQTNPEVFHDVTQGDNIVPCAPGSPDCGNGRMGFSAGKSYDRATGLGSVDATVFVHDWVGSTPQSSAVVPSIDQVPVFQQPPDDAGNKWTFRLTLNEEAGIATTLTGMTIDGKVVDPKTSFTTTAIPARGFITSNSIGLATVAAPKTVLFTFTGADASGKSWSQDLSVPFQTLQIRQSVAGATNAASGQTSYAPGMLMSVYGTNLGASSQPATSIPWPYLLAGFEAFVNSVPAPLMYVSPGQVNIQIPYEVVPGGSATLVVGNPYDSAAYTFPISASAPGIFSAGGFTIPFASVKPGDTTTLFITGDGLVSGNLKDGDTPDPATPVNQLPSPILDSSVTVGGLPAPIAFIGIPSGVVGITQIDFTIPVDTPPGVQPVVVTIGKASSPPVKITVTP